MSSAADPFRIFVRLEGVQGQPIEELRPKRVSDLTYRATAEKIIKLTFPLGHKPVNLEDYDVTLKYRDEKIQDESWWIKIRDNDHLHCIIRDATALGYLRVSATVSKAMRASPVAALPKAEESYELASTGIPSNSVSKKRTAVYQLAEGHEDEKMPARVLFPDGGVADDAWTSSKTTFERESLKRTSVRQDDEDSEGAYPTMKKRAASPRAVAASADSGAKDNRAIRGGVFAEVKTHPPGTNEVAADSHGIGEEENSKAGAESVRVEPLFTLPSTEAFGIDAETSDQFGMDISTLALTDSGYPTASASSAHVCVASAHEASSYRDVDENVLNTLWKALTLMESVQIPSIPKIHLAVLAGYRHVKSDEIAKALSFLYQSGYTTSAKDKLSLTEKGRRKLAGECSRPRLCNEEVHRRMKQLLAPFSDVSLKIFDILKDGKWHEKPELMKALQYTHEKSVKFANALALMRALSIISYSETAGSNGDPKTKLIRLQDIAFPEGRSRNRRRASARLP